MEKPASTRQLKVAREIQKDLAEIIRGKGMAVFGGAMVTVSEVRVSPDLSLAKTYVSIFPSAKAEEVMKLLNDNVKALRGELGHQVAKQLRIVPEIVFYLDTSLDYAEHIDELRKKEATREYSGRGFSLQVRGQDTLRSPAVDSHYVDDLHYRKQMGQVRR